MEYNYEITDKMDSCRKNPYITKIKEIVNKVIMNITVEPVIFFYAIGFGITTIISPALYFDKICKVIIQILIFLNSLRKTFTLATLQKS